MSGTSGKGSTETGTCHYEPFGEVRPGTTCSVPTVYRFAGMEWDGEIGGHGLYHTWFRQYDPSHGRWTGVDPLAGSPDDPQSFNRYVYVRNDPVNLIDPFGLADCHWDFERDGLICSIGVPPPSGGDDPPIQLLPGQCYDVFLDGLKIGNTCNRGGRIVFEQTDTPFRFTFGVRGPNETWTDCMRRTASTYSMGGSAELVANVATGTTTDVMSNPFIGAVAGNQITGLIFGSIETAGGIVATNTPEVAASAMGSPLTHGRRTSDITSMNIHGKTGPGRAVLQQSSGRLQAGLRGLGKVLNFGLGGTLRFGIDAALAGAQALNCGFQQ